MFLSERVNWRDDLRVVPDIWGKTSLSPKFRLVQRGGFFLLAFDFQKHPTDMT